MRTSISFNLTQEEAKKTRTLAKVRGFRSTSDYLRFLISQDDAQLVSEDELVKRAADVKRLYKAGKLVKVKSLEKFIK